MKKIFLKIVIFVCLNAITYSQTYIDFTENDLNGNEVKLSLLLEKGPVMMAFWRTWCPSCKEEQKAMQNIYEKYKQYGFEYIGVNVDNQRSVSKVKPFVSAQNFTFKVILDTDKKIFEMCGGSDDIMPYSLILDKNEETVYTHIGFKSGDEYEIEEEIKRILNIK